MKRRTFLKSLGAGLTIPFSFGGAHFSALARAAWAGSPLIAGGEADRVLVIVQMEGGNDGLNMLVPVDDDRYYTARPTIAIAKRDALPLRGNDLLRFHPALHGLQRMYDEERLAVVTNIGYDNYSLSHFSGTEIWNTGSGTARGEMQSTGWLGRYLRGEFPLYPELLPEDPPAVQIRPSTSSAFNIRSATFGVALTDPIAFHELVNGTPALQDEQTAATPAAEEWRYIRTIEAQSVGFSRTIRRAALNASNAVIYPADNPLAESLAIVARLIAGGLRTRIYMVNVGNFDTHGNQLQHQGYLLGKLDEALKAFNDDTVALGIDRRVVGMTYSEFGRRIFESASGTDHGAAAPHFVFGTAVDGGRVFGNVPDLEHPDDNGNLRHELSFQCYYASVLGPLFGLTEERLSEALPIGLCGAQDRLPLFRSAVIGTPFPTEAGTLTALPNPAVDHTVLRFRLPSPGRTRLYLYAEDGTLVGAVLDELRPAGEQTVRIETAGLASGVYGCRLNAVGVATSVMIVVRR